MSDGTDLRLLVTGSRLWYDALRLGQALDEAAAGYRRVTLVHGKCDPRWRATGEVIPWDETGGFPTMGLIGADWLAHQHAFIRGWDIEPHPADWNKFGLSAGPRRNRVMVKRGADRCLGFPLGLSSGTRGCLKLAIDARIPVTTYEG